MALIPAGGDGPGEQVERREEVARSREALQALKPAELRALGLLAEGYSYVEIGRRTGWSRTKINRLLAEGRASYRALVSSSEDGSRCRELQPLLSAFCDGETAPRQADEVREHLRACAQCRATMRTYRAAPRAAAALLPLLPSRSLLDRAQDLAGNLASRLPGFGAGESAATQVAAAGGTRGAGMAAIAKLLTVCAGAAGGAAACVATGVLPAPVPAPIPIPNRRSNDRRTARSMRAKTRPSTISLHRRRPKRSRASRRSNRRRRRRMPRPRPPNRAPRRRGRSNTKRPRRRRTCEQQRSVARPQPERLGGRGVRSVNRRADPSATRCGPRRAVKRCTAAIALALSLALVCRSSGGLDAADRSDGRRRRGQLAPNRMFALSWTNPPGVVAVHYRLLDPNGAVLIGDTRLPWAASAIEHLSVPPAPGAYRTEVWLEQAGGATGSAVGATLRFDDRRPGIVEPISSTGWIGRSAFPYTLRITHPSGPLPISGIRGYAVSTDASPAGSPCAGDLLGGRVRPARWRRCRLAADRRAPRGDQLRARSRRLRLGNALGPGRDLRTARRQDRAADADRGRAHRLDTGPRNTDRGGRRSVVGNGGVGDRGPVHRDPDRRRHADDAPGASVSATVIASGVHTVAYYARDAAGNVADGATTGGRTNRPPATTVVRIDREPPQLAFAAAQAGKCRA